MYGDFQLTKKEYFKVMNCVRKDEKEEKFREI
jgi:hypothetical protein